MSRRPFKDKVGKDGLEKGASYKQGDPGYDPALVDEVMNWFLGIKRSDPYIVTDGNRDFFVKCVERCTDWLLPEVDGEFEHQNFLDALVRELTVRNAENFSLARMDTLFSPLVQALYDLGHNGFSIDVFPLSQIPYRMASYLSGTEDNPLKLSYNGRAWSFGQYPTYCQLECFGEVYHMAGNKARDSEVVLHNPPEGMGDLALDTKFFLHGVDDIAIPQRIYPPRLELVLKMGSSEDKITVQNTFFKNRNSIYIPDGNGGWKEVPPR